MKILMVAHLSGSLKKGDNDRFKYLANMLYENGHEIEIITSDFEHHKKEYRDHSDVELYPYKITFIHENSYSKNISFKRLVAHYKFSKELKKVLKKRNPDVIYCAFPPIESSLVVAKYCKKNKIKLVTDIQDLWPEAFKIKLGYNIFSKIILMPMQIKADKVFKLSNKVIGVSKTYADFGSKYMKNTSNSISVFLGTDVSKFDKLSEIKNNYKIGNYFEVLYLGNLGYSYDLKTIIRAIKVVGENGYPNIRLVVVGGGPFFEEFKDFSEESGINSLFTGKLSYDEIPSIISKCHIAVNPIKKGPSSIVNKVGDYAAAGLPVINTQDSQEYKEIIENYKIGYNCKNGDYVDIANKICYLIQNEVLRVEMGNNNRNLAIEKFDREKTYKQIVNFIEN